MSCSPYRRARRTTTLCSDGPYSLGCREHKFSETHLQDAESLSMWTGAIGMITLSCAQPRSYRVCILVHECIDIHPDLGDQALRPGPLVLGRGVDSIPAR